MVQMVNIRCVAKKAGVSTGTVSNVLSGNRPVSDKVRSRVLQAIDELGYHPNMIAHSLITGKSKTIAVVLPGFQLDIDGVLIGIDSALQEKGYSLLVSRLSAGESPAKHLRSLFSRGIDGVIWSVPETESSRDWVEITKLDPDISIVLAFHSPLPGYSSIRMDNFSGGYVATKHLLEHGCRRIGHISGPLRQVEAKERMAGFERALEEAGLEPVRVYEGDWQISGGVSGMANMLEQWPDIEAVFASNDRTAFGVMNTLRRSGRRIPEDVKLIGFDDNLSLDYTNPPLTTIRQEYASMGTRAVKELFSRIEDPNRQPGAQTLPTQLILRQSCGCNHVNTEDPSS